MKKLFYLIALTSSLTSFSQSSKWFVSVSTGTGLGGPSAALKSQMSKQGFAELSNYNFLGWSGSTQYPVKTEFPNMLLRFGKNMTTRKSIFFVTGIADQGEVTGFRATGYGSFFGIFGGSSGPMPSVRYTMYQATGGLMYAANKSRAKLGFGPSIFLLRYAMNEEDKKTAFVPGALLTGRFPLGKEKKLFGVEFIMDVRIAPPATIKSDVKPEDTSFRPGKVNMISAGAGIAFCLRK